MRLAPFSPTPRADALGLLLVLALYAAGLFGPAWLASWFAGAPPVAFSSTP